MSDFELSAGEFRALYDRVQRMSRRGPADRLGALNNISPAQVVAAARDVWRGRAVSLEAPVESEVTPDNPDPAVHQMTATGTGPGAASGLSFALDRVAMNIHGNADSHIDALSHVIFDGTLYNGLSPGAVTARGRPSSPSKRRPTGSSAVACCSTFRGCGECRGSSRVIT